jgi:hypothetical protein
MNNSIIFNYIIITHFYLFSFLDKENKEKLVFFSYSSVRAKTARANRESRSPLAHRRECPRGSLS